MVSMWFNATVFVGQVTVAVATVCGLAMLRSPGVEQESASVQQEMFQPLYGMTASSEDGDFVAVKINGHLALGGPFQEAGIEEGKASLNATRLAYCRKTGAIAIGTNNATVYLADARFPGLTELLAEITSPVTSLSFSEDGKYLCGGDVAGGLHIWNLESGSHRLIQVIDEPIAVHVHTYVSGRQLAVARVMDGRLRILDLETGNTLRELKTGFDQIHSNCTSPTGHRFAAVGTHGYREDLKMFDGDTRACLWTYSIEQIGEEVCLPCCISLAPDSSTVLLATGPYLLLLDTETGKVLKSLTSQGSRVSSISWLPGKNEFLSSGYDGHVTLWDGTTLRKKWSTTSDLAVSPLVDDE